MRKIPGIQWAVAATIVFCSFAYAAVSPEECTAAVRTFNERIAPEAKNFQQKIAVHDNALANLKTAMEAYRRAKAEAEQAQKNLMKKIDQAKPYLPSECKINK